MSAKRGLPSKKRMRHDRHFVDELTKRSGEGIGRMIPIESISSSDDQPRTHLGDLEDLVSSIRIHGILEPLLVRRDSGGAYELISGERRFSAAKEVGLTDVPCIELVVSDEHAVEIALIENLQRKDLSPFEEADGFRTLIEKFSYTHEQVANAVGRSRVTVSEALKLEAISKELRDRCRHADINAKGILLEVAKAPNEASMAILINEIVELGLDREDVRRRRQELAESENASEMPEETSNEQNRKVKPFVMKFKHPEEGFSVALSFKAGRQPDPRKVISALEEMIAELREDFLEGSDKP
jgi:ParB family chromosome partitioning protein